MSERMTVDVLRDDEGCVVRVHVHDAELDGVFGRLEVKHRAHVKRGSPVHHEYPVATRRVTLRQGENRIVLGDAVDRRFAYVGDKLDLRLVAKLTLADGVIFNTDVDIDLSPGCRLVPRTARNDQARSVHSPSDRFDFFANLRAIPAAARAKVLWLLIVGVPIVLGNLLVGTRDQFVPNSQVWFYDHRASDGDSESPLFKALIGSGAVGAGIWMMILAQLRRYMTFESSTPEGLVTRGTLWHPEAMIRGKPRVPLQQVTLRLVAYNREHGQYTKREKKGKSSRTVTKEFVNDACGVVLYERLLPFVPAGGDVQRYLSGHADVGKVFDALYPPVMLGPHHGLSIRFEAQLLHPEFVDQEVILERVEVDMAAFYPS